MKIRQVWADMCHAYGRTDITKLNSRFSQFCERAYKLDEAGLKTIRVICGT